MNEKWIDQLFELGSKKGFSDQEVYYMKNKSTDISVFQGEIEKFNLSEDGGLSYRAILNGKVGYAYTELFDETSIEMLVNEAYQNAEIIESEDEIYFHDGSGVYTSIDNYNEAIEKSSIESKIEFMKNLEKQILTKDERVKRLAQNGYDEVSGSRVIRNTKGLNVTDQYNYCLAYAMSVVSDGTDTRTGIGYDVSDDFEELSADKIASETTSEALAMLGASSMASGVYPVVIKNETFAQLISAYMGIFNAERVQKNMSKLKGQLGETIASEAFTLVDHPHLQGALSSSSFDAEGVATIKKAIVEKGKLNTFLHNLKTAKKEGISSTGNASKGSYKGTIGIAPSNLIIESGEQSFDEMIGGVDSGVYIISLQGLHAGIDTISGDFSLQCYGFEIQSGKLGRPVSQITLSGNFFDLLKDIECFANDFRFSILSGYYTGSASVKINNLTISGE